MDCLIRIKNDVDNSFTVFSFQDRVRVPGHLSSCECSPEVALKIQFLRLVHSFCDQSEYRVRQEEVKVAYLTVNSTVYIHIYPKYKFCFSCPLCSSEIMAV